MSWSEEDRENLTNFINELLYEKMDASDYHNIMRRLDIKCRGNRYQTCCHNVNGGGYNLAFNEESKTFTCFSECGCSYSLLSLVKKRRKLLYENSGTVASLKWICEELGVECNFKDEIKRDNNIYNWKKLLRYSKDNNSIELKTYDKNVLTFLPKIYHEDWIDYGISEQTLEKYDIRWYEYKQQIVIPCKDKEGNLIGIRVRNMNPQIDIKYIPFKLLNGDEYNFPTNEVFYGENFNWVNIQRTKSVILVESEKTVMKYEDWYGYENNICLGLYGSNMSYQKLRKLLSWGCETFYIALDSDFEEISYSNENEENTLYEKFEKKVMKIYDIIKPYAKEVYVIYNNLSFKDCYKFSITDYNKEDFEKLWDSKEII